MKLSEKIFAVIVICLFATFGIAAWPDILGLITLVGEWASANAIWIFMVAVQFSLLFICFQLRSIDRMDSNQLLEKLLAQAIITNNKLYDLEQAMNPTKRANVVEIYVTKDGVREKVEHMFAKSGAVIDLDGDFKYKDADGNLQDAEIDGVPAWALTDESLAKFEVDAADASKAVLTVVGTKGKFKMQLKADADRGEGVREILGELEIEILGPEAEVVVISATVR